MTCIWTHGCMSADSVALNVSLSLCLENLICSLRNYLIMVDICWFFVGDSCCHKGWTADCTFASDTWTRSFDTLSQCCASTAQMVSIWGIMATFFGWIACIGHKLLLSLPVIIHHRSDRFRKVRRCLWTSLYQIILLVQRNLFVALIGLKNHVTSNGSNSIATLLFLLCTAVERRFICL